MDPGVAVDNVEHPEKLEGDLVVVVDIGLTLQVMELHHFPWTVTEVERFDIDFEAVVDDSVGQDLQ